MAEISVERISFEQALATLLSTYGVEGAESGTILSTRLTLINSVKAKLDEIIPEGEGLQFSVEGNTNVSDPLNLLINAVLNEAAKRVLLNAPLHIVDPVTSDIANGTVDAKDSNIGYFELPDNFIRFVSLKMSDWERQISSVLKPQVDVEEYAMQQNPYVRGGTAHPKAAYSFRATKRVIEYYSVLDSHVIDWFCYIQETEAEDLQQNLTDALAWHTAGIVLQITERNELAKNAFLQEQASYENL